MSTIFLAGVHGVGKGYLGIPVAKALGISHYTASQLIREEKGRSTWGVDKKASDLDDNQVALIRAVAQTRSTHGDILLDGHFVLRNAQGALVALAPSVFKELQLIGVILLTESPAIIADRLVKRDGPNANVEAISQLAEAESIHAHKVCLELALPLHVLQSPSERSMTGSIKMMLQVATDG
jgi:adenylate kinase